MGFLNAALLFGMAAAAVPIALHLLGRRQPKRLEFAAIRFLKQQIETNRRRLQVRHLSLLALRIMALAGLALALAQPLISSDARGTWMTIGLTGLIGLMAAAVAVWGFVAGKPVRLFAPIGGVALTLLLASTGWGIFTATASASPRIRTQGTAAVAIVVDSSVRMEYQVADESRLEVAKLWANWIVDHYAAGSSIAITDRSPRPVVAAIDIAAARRAIKRMRTLQVVSPLGQRIEAATSLLANSQLEQRRLYVITDLTQASWDTSETIELPGGMDVFVIDVGDSAVGNRKLGEVQLPAESIARGIPSSVRVGVSSQGNFPSPEIAIELRLADRDLALPTQRNGQVVYPEFTVADRQLVAIPESSVAEVTLSLPALGSSIQHGQIMIAGTDGLPIDNVRYFSLAINDPPRVLVVCNSTNERHVLGQALALPGVSGTGDVDYEVDEQSVAGLADTDLSAYRVIAMLDPPRLPSVQHEKLKGWVESGGKLLVSFGSEWVSDDDQREATVMGSPIRQWRVPSPGRSIVLDRSSHPALLPFESIGSDVPWQLYPIHRYWQIEPTDGDIEIARYAGTKHSALLERAVGAGRIMILTTPIPGVEGVGRSWNELFSTSEDYWPAFLLVRGVFHYLSDRDPGTLNVSVGQPVGLKTPGGEAGRFQLFSPSGAPVVVESSVSQVTPGPPPIAGNYWLRGSQAILGYSANLEPSATNLDRIEDDQLNEILGGGNYHLVREREQLDWTATTGSVAQPFYAQIMLLVCGVFVLEQLLANRFYS